MLPIRLVVDADGYLSALRARGYVVEAPDDVDTPGAAAGTH